MRLISGAMLFLIVGMTQGLAADLAGSEWGFASDDKRFVQFQGEGKVFGHGGCNRFFGGYVTGADGQLSFSALGATRMACPELIMQQEAAFLGILENAKAMKQEGMRLQLLDEQQNLLAELVRKDWD